MIAATDSATKLMIIGTLGLILGILIWASWRSSRASGWTDLARSYAGSGKIAGKSFALPFLLTGKLAHFGGAFVRVGDEALQLSMTGPFFLFHPRLTIPWGRIHRIVRHPDQPDLQGISFTDHDLIYYFDGAAFDAVRKAWENHRRSALTSDQ